MKQPAAPATRSLPRLSPFWLLTILTGLNLFNYLDRYVLPAVVKSLKTEFHLDNETASRANTIFMIGYFVTSPFFGLLGDRLSRKWLIAGGILVWSLGTVLTGFAPTFAVLLCYRVLVGVGEASYATISPSLISDAFPAKRRNNALTIFYVAIPVGGALGNILGGWMAEDFGWRWAFIWAGAPGLLLALVLLPFSDPERGQSDSATAIEKPRWRDVTGLFRRLDYQLVVWGYTAYTFGLGGFGFWGPTFLQEVHGVQEGASGKFFGMVLFVAGLLGTLVGGLAATAWQKRKRNGYAMVLTLSVITAAPLGFVAFWAEHKLVAMSCLAAAMFFIFLSAGPINTLILETVPVNVRATAMAVSIFMIHMFGDMWSPQIIGALSDRWHSLQKAVMISPAALAISALLWGILSMRMRRTEDGRLRMEDRIEAN